MINQHYRVVKVFFFLIILISIDVFASGYFDGDTSLAKNYYKTGDDHFEKAQYDSVLVYLEKAEKIFYSNEMWSNSVSCLNRISHSLRKLGNIDSALAISELALEIGEQHSIGDTLMAQVFDQIGSAYLKKNNFTEAFRFSLKAKEILEVYPAISFKSENYSLLGQIYRETSNYDSALIFFEKATNNTTEIYGEDHPSLRYNYADAALTFVEKGDYEKALEYNFKARDLVINAFGELHSELAIVYNNIAINYFYSGENDLALEYYLKALSIDLILLEPENPELGTRYNNIAMAYRVTEDYDKAIEFSLKAKDIWYSSFGDKHPYYAIAINNIGRIYSDKKDSDMALEYFLSAYEILKEVLGETHPLTAQAENNIGEAYTNKEDYDNGLAFLTRSLSGRLNALGSKHPKVAVTLIEIGKNYYYQDLPDSALYYFQQAVFASTDGFDENNVYANPSLSLSRYDKELLQALFFKARTFNKKYLLSGNLEDLQLSLNTYKLCSELSVRMRQSYKSESSKFAVGEIGYDIILEGISTAKRLYDVSGNKVYLETAFDFAENGKAGVLSDALSEVRAKSFSGIADSLLEKERQLRIDLASYDTQLQKENEKKEAIDSTKLKTLEDSFFSLHREYEDLISYLEKNYYEYFRLKYKDDYFSISEVTGNLDNNSAILEYVVSDSALFIFTITSFGASLKQVPLGNLLKDDVISFRKSLFNINTELYIEEAYKLYSLLIKPVERELNSISKLYIIPDGILNYLPFEALLTGKVENKINPDFKELPYLINRYDLSYYFSVSMLFNRRVRNISTSGFVGFAPVFPDSKETQLKIASLVDTSALLSTRAVNVSGHIFSSLPETEKEVDDISRLYENNGHPAKVFKRSLATEEVLKSNEMSSFGVVHIASHGFINENNPKLSGIIFWLGETDNTEDGILYSSEVYNLNLNADLVVLSACESGLGKVAKGEGMIGLTRGFIYAGAENILVSLWQVADKSTSELMIRFYKELLSGRSFSSSLREAKLQLIKEGTYSYPLEWSPFVLIGSN